MRKYMLILLGAIGTLFFAGCSVDDAEARRELAENFVTAAASGDEDGVWEAFSPESRENFVKILGNGDEERAREELLKIFQHGLKKRYTLKHTDDLLDDEKLFETAVSQILDEPGKKFVKIDDEYFLSAESDEISKK